MRRQLDMRVARIDTDLADIVALQAASLAQHRQQPFGVSVLLAAHIDGNPDGAGDVCAFRARTFLARRTVLPGRPVRVRHPFLARSAVRTLGADAFGTVAQRALGAFPIRLGAAVAGAVIDIAQVFRCRAAFALGAHKSGSHGGSPVLGEELLDQQLLVLGRGLAEGGVRQEAGIILAGDLVCRGRLAPGCGNLRVAEEALHAAARLGGDQQRADALATGPARAARAVEQGGRIARQVRMDHEAEVLQVKSAGGNVGGDADAGAAVAQGLQRVGAFLLAEFAGEGDDREAAIAHPAHQLVHGGARRAKDQRAFGVRVANDVDDGVLFVAGGDEQGLVFDVDVLALLGLGGNARRILLIAGGEGGNAFRHGGREHQCTALFRRTLEDQLELLAEAHVEHLVGLVQHHDAHAASDEGAALDMVCQATGRADDDVRAAFEGTAFVAHVHAANAGRKAGAGNAVKPAEFARDLHGQFARRRNDQGKRRGGGGERVFAGQERVCHGEAEGDGLAGAGLRGDEEVLVGQVRHEDGGLYLGEISISACGKCAGECGGECVGEVHYEAFGR